LTILKERDLRRPRDHRHLAQVAVVLRS